VIFPRVALGKIVVVAADELDAVEGDFPFAAVELAGITALGDVDRVVGFAFLQRFKRIAERFFLGAITRGAGANEPVACMNG
jgi:hypothetical protein